MMAQKIVIVEPKGEDSQMKRAIDRDAGGYAGYWNCLYGLLILFACILYTSVLTFIPRHNSILYPDYWYEAMILFIGISIRNTALTIVELYIFTNAKALLSMQVIFKAFIGIWLLFAVPYCAGYLIWTYHLGYHLQKDQK